MKEIQGVAVVHCPVCGMQVVIEKLWVDSVEPFRDELSVNFRKTSTRHICEFGPDTDGLNPIERFLKHGKLDDIGKGL